jgi:hypothetical protein
MVIRIWLWIEFDTAGKSRPKLGKPSAQVVECDCNVTVFGVSAPLTIVPVVLNSSKVGIKSRG